METILTRGLMERKGGGGKVIEYAGYLKCIMNLHETSLMWLSII